MNIIVFLFFIILSSILIITFTDKKPEKIDICYENKLKFYNSLKTLLWVYLSIFFVLLFYICKLEMNICANMLLLLYGFITVGFIIILSINIGMKKIQCLTNNITMYLSLIPLFILGLISIVMGYLGNILIKKT